MTISFTITVYNELFEFDRLVSLIKEVKTETDEIIILHTYKDILEQDGEIFQEIKKISTAITDKYENYYFQNSFSDLKNYLINLATKEYIFNFDADEYFTIETFNSWKKIIDKNNYDVYYIPRINTVDGYTLIDIKNYGWIINDNGWINWPDYQPRIFKNIPNIQWSGNVHETITGSQNLSALPADPRLAIIHHKTIDKQRTQNNFYNTLKR